MVRNRIFFIGRVQGVGFRATARSVAARFRLTGWVRNEPDGSVMLEAQGEPEEIGAFLNSLRAVMDPFIRSESTVPVDIDPAETQFDIRR